MLFSISIFYIFLNFDYTYYINVKIKDNKKRLFLIKVLKSGEKILTEEERGV